MACAGDLFVFASHQLIRGNHRHIMDAQKPKHMTDKRCREIDVGSRCRAARRNDDISFLTLKEADRTIFSVLECLAGAGDEVDPGFERCRHPEIVNWNPKNNFIGGLKLCDQCVGVRKRVLLCRRTSLIRGDIRANPVLGQKREGFNADISCHYLGVCA